MGDVDDEDCRNLIVVAGEAGDGFSRVESVQEKKKVLSVPWN